MDALKKTGASGASLVVQAADALYPIVYLDCIHVKVKVKDGSVRVKAVYLAIGISMSGEEEVPGLWIAQSERRQTLLAGGDRTEKPRRAGHVHCLRRSKASRKPSRPSIPGQPSNGASSIGYGTV